MKCFLSSLATLPHVFLDVYILQNKKNTCTSNINTDDVPAMLPSKFMTEECHWGFVLGLW